MKVLRLVFAFSLVVCVVASAWFYVDQKQQQARYTVLSQPSEDAVWPLRDAGQSTPRQGITYWRRATADGTMIDFYQFDFAANPGLRLELYDQDEDDATPFDNKIAYWNRGILPVARSLHQKLQSDNRELIALWNGSFFGLKNLKPREKDYCFHVSPIVLNGKVLYNTSNHRWSFGVKNINGKPCFGALHLPGRAALQANFDFATGAAQCLIKDGASLKIEDFPRENQAPKKQPVASTPLEAGHIPILDHMKTSRVSVAWTGDSSKLFLLVVKEPDSETPSRAAVEKRVAANGGWMLADVQRFWLSAKQDLKIENAVALDGGDVAQMGLRQSEDEWIFSVARLALPDLKLNATQQMETKLEDTVLHPEISRGGSIMYFYVSAAKK